MQSFHNFLWLLWLTRARGSRHNWVKNCIDLDWRETLLGGWGPQKGVEKLKDRQKKIEKSQKKFPVRIVLVMCWRRTTQSTFGTHEVYKWGCGFAVCKTTWFLAKLRDKSRNKTMHTEQKKYKNAVLKFLIPEFSRHTVQNAQFLVTIHI